MALFTESNLKREDLPYYDELLKYLEDSSFPTDQILSIELSNRLEARIIFSKGYHEECYKAAKDFMGIVKSVSSKYKKNATVFPLKVYGDNDKTGPVFYIGNSQFVFMPPANVSPRVNEPMDHDKLLKKYDLPTKRTTIEPISNV